MLLCATRCSDPWTHSYLAVAFEGIWRWELPVLLWSWCQSWNWILSEVRFKQCPVNCGGWEAYATALLKNRAWQTHWTLESLSVCRTDSCESGGADIIKLHLKLVVNSNFQLLVVVSGNVFLMFLSERAHCDMSCSTYFHAIFWNR